MFLLTKIKKTMKENNRMKFLHAFRASAQKVMLRAGVCLFLLSGTGTLMAQEDAMADTTTKARPIAKKTVTKKYPMKKISGSIFDAATQEPMGGVRIQALADKRYTAMTEDNGTYTMRGRPSRRTG